MWLNKNTALINPYTKGPKLVYRATVRQLRCLTDTLAGKMLKCQVIRLSMILDTSSHEHALCFPETQFNRLRA